MPITATMALGDEEQRNREREEVGVGEGQWAMWKRPPDAHMDTNCFVLTYIRACGNSYWLCVCACVCVCDATACGIYVNAEVGKKTFRI